MSSTLTSFGVVVLETPSSRVVWRRYQAVRCRLLSSTEWSLPVGTARVPGIVVVVVVGSTLVVVGETVVVEVATVVGREWSTCFLKDRRTIGWAGHDRPSQHDDQKRTRRADSMSVP
jgi:hypothetical protein